MALVYRFDDFELDAEHLELRRAGVLMRADALVLRLLRCLARNAGRLVSKDELVSQVWEAHVVADNAITVAVARLRKTLGQNRDQKLYVTTLYGRGYRLECEVTAIEAPDRPPSLLSRVHDVPPPFVGRERVLLSLIRALKQAGEGRGGACLVIGEAGIGKSRVVEELAREAQNSEARVAWGYCRETGDTPPLDPWLRILREVLAHTPRASLDAALGTGSLELLESLFERHVPEPVGSTLAPPPILGHARFRTFDKLARAFAVAAEAEPWLFVIEDIHRADAASLEFFAYLLDELRRLRVSVVATARPSPVRRVGTPVDPLARVLGHTSCQRFTLERLRREDVGQYVSAVLDDTDGQLANAVFEKSEGNPFFMAELSRQLRAMEKAQAAALSVPAAALDIVWQPITRLDARVRRVLSAAAVLGRNFELSRLQSVIDGDRTELMAYLDEAIASELLIAAPGSMTAFAFSHELVRNVLYDALDPAERRHWHLKSSHVLERCQTAGEPVPPSELAHHSYAALPESDPRKTIEHCRAAAVAAGERFANSDVARYLRHALEAFELIDGASVRLRMNLLFSIGMYARTCDPEESISALKEVLRLATDRGDPVQLVRAACLLNVHVGYAPLADGTPPLKLALQLLGDGDPAQRSAALAGLACAAPQTYSEKVTRELFDQAVPLARRSGEVRSVYTTLAYKLWALGGPAETAESAQIVRELELLAAEHPKRMPVLPLDLAVYRALMALQHGDQARASGALESAAARSRQLGKGMLGWHVDRATQISRVNSGQCDGVLDELSRLHAKARASLVHATAVFEAFDRSVVAREITGESTLDEPLHDVLAYDPTDPPTLWSMKVRALAAAGFIDEASALLRRLPPEDIADLPCSPHYLGTLGHLARAAVMLRSHAEMAVLYPLLAKYPNHFAGHVSFFAEGPIEQLLGMIAHASGRLPEAVAHLERAIELADGAGLKLCAADARLELARVLLASGGTRTPRVVALARDAQSMAERAGARRIAIEAAAVLRPLS
jgi:DNA-binding winged helix-turn-helix (wHTH) protein/tetratricopeptide (TPR) repeat protein